MLQYVKLQTNPDVICLPATSDTLLLEAAGSEVPGVGGDAGRLGGYEVQLERSAAFVHEKVIIEHALGASCWLHGCMGCVSYSCHRQLHARPG